MSVESRQTPGKDQVIMNVRPYLVCGPDWMLPVLGASLGCQSWVHRDSGIFSLPLLDCVKGQLLCLKRRSLKIVLLSKASPKSANGWEPLRKT